MYNTLASPTFVCGNEWWTIEAKDRTRIADITMIFVRSIAQCTWMDHTRKGDIT